jgi:2-polyprenyl-3-methyl-5-hydroxy-6-metoxy-1,4-benzoquinol methylase
MAIDARAFYDGYWGSRDLARSEARSRERASIALRLLAGAGLARGRLLDLGCGPGWALEAFRAAGFCVRGADVSSAAVEEARARGLDVLPLDLERSDGESLRREAGEGFDAVTLLEVLEHLSDPLGALRRARSLLSPGGLMVVSLPNEIALPARLAVLAGRLPFGGHDDPHVRHFDRRRARRLLVEAGLRILAERPVSIVPPGRRTLRAILAPAARILPGPLSLATVYLARPEDHAP